MTVFATASQRLLWRPSRNPPGRLSWVSSLSIVAGPSLPSGRHDNDDDHTVLTVTRLSTPGFARVSCPGSSVAEQALTSVWPHVQLVLGARMVNCNGTCAIGVAQRLANGEMAALLAEAYRRLHECRREFTVEIERNMVWRAEVERLETVIEGLQSWITTMELERAA